MRVGCRFILRFRFGSDIILFRTHYLPPPRLWVVANVRIGQARSSTAVLGRPKKTKLIPRQLTSEAIAFLWACLVVVRAPRGEAVDGGGKREEAGARAVV